MTHANESINPEKVAQRLELGRLTAEYQASGKEIEKIQNGLTRAALNDYQDSLKRQNQARKANAARKRG